VERLVTRVPHARLVHRPLPLLALALLFALFLFKFSLFPQLSHSLDVRESLFVFPLLLLWRELLHLGGPGRELHFNFFLPHEHGLCYRRGVSG